MNIYTLPALLSLIVNFSVALVVLMERPKAALNRWFAGFIFSFALWNISEVIILNSAEEKMALFAAQILYRVLFLAPAFYVSIAYLFPRPLKTSPKPLFYIIVFALPVLALSFSFPNFQIALVFLRDTPKTYFYKFRYNPTPSFLILLTIGLSYIIWASAVLIGKLKHLKTVRQKNQTRFFVTGMILIFFTFITILILKANLQAPIYLYFLSTILTFFVAIFFFVALVQFHLFKPAKLFSDGTTYFTISAFILASYFLIIRVLSASLESFLGMDSSVFDVFVVVSLVILILPFEERIRKLFDRWLNKDTHNYRKSILKLFRELQSYFLEKDFYRIVSEFILSNFKAEAVYIFSIPDEDEGYRDISSNEEVPEIPLDSFLIHRLKQTKETIEFYELPHSMFDKANHDFFETVHARLFVPIIFEDDLLGIILLSRKKHGIEYHQDELEILTILGNETAAAYHRNKVIEKMRQRDRDHFRLEKLAALGQLTAGITHEIRNPLNTISTSAQTLLNKDISTEDRAELLGFIVDEANRLNRILNDFLNLSKTKPPQTVRIDVDELLQRLVLHLQNTVEKEIEICYRISAVDKFISSDPDLLFQALLNLGLNAWAAIRERVLIDESFICEHGQICCTFSNSGKYFKFTISDNGVGISEPDSESVYNPFFTTKPEGTGLGLAIVHQIISALAGKIDFTSRPGRTVFNLYIKSH